MLADLQRVMDENPILTEPGVDIYDKRALTTEQRSEILAK
jgi:hypothetical protein